MNLLINTGTKYTMIPEKRYVMDFYAETDATLHNHYEPLKKQLLEEMEKESIDCAETDKLLITYVAKSEDEEAHLNVIMKSDLLSLPDTNLGLTDFSSETN